MRKILTIITLLLLPFCIFAKGKERTEPFDRGIAMPTSCFIPKGCIGGGLSISYANYDLGNSADDVGYKMLFSLVQGLQGSMNSFGVSPFLSYFLADNVSIGLRFDYSRKGFQLANASLNISDELGLNINDLNYLKQSYTGALTLRDYIPIADSRRFAMFAELRIGGSYAQSISYKMVNGDKTGTYQDIYNGSVGLIPGISCFVTNETAIEVSIGVLGYEYQKVIQKTNQVEVSQMENSQANFKINLLSINLGISVYIPVHNYRIRKAARYKIQNNE